MQIKEKRIVQDKSSYIKKSKDSFDKLLVSKWG